MKLRIALVALGFAMGAGQAAHANDAVGVWLTDEGKAKVRLSPCGGRLCSEIIWLREATDESGKPLRDHLNPDPRLRNRPILGMEILQNLQPAGHNQWDGHIYNPENGKLYIAHVTIAGSYMRLKGCVSWGWPCGEQTWMRVKETGAPAQPARAHGELRQARSETPPPAPAVAAPKPVLGTAAGTQLAAVQPSVAAKPPVAVAARSDGDDYLVQIASRKSEKDAMIAFSELQRQYPNLLGAYQPSILTADLGTKGVWYRVHIGPMNRKNDAASFCDRFKSAGGDCIVRRME
jgi:uncharacterized protein (DUF2147 family)